MKVARCSRGEVIGLLGLALLVAAMLALTWRAWPDHLVDFGREVYVPWSLNDGAVLYRDTDGNYGPFSPAFNALVFRVLGPGILHLVAVNFLIYVAILTLLYLLLRRAWGVGGAWVGCAVFIGVFSFSQYTVWGSYNYLAPYSHETTHGMLAILALIAAWSAWTTRPRPWLPAVAGLFTGLCALLKVEIFVVALAVSAAAAGLMALARPEWRRVRPWVPVAAAFGMAALVPPLVATLALLATGRFSVVEAALWANAGWTGLFLYADIARESIQASFLGTDDIAGNVRAILLAGGIAAAFAGLCLVAGRWLNGQRAVVIVAAVMMVGALGWLAAPQVPWVQIGRVFPIGLLLAAVLVRYPRDRHEITRVLLLVAAAFFLARMALNPRIYQYGFSQAALAGVVTVAALWSSLPAMTGLPGRGRFAFRALLATGLVIAVGHLVAFTAAIASSKRQWIGEGADAFRAYGSSVDPVPAYLEETRRFLAGRDDCRLLFAMPEGVILNYLLRKRSPTHTYLFTPFWMKWRASVLRDLDARPPDYVVLVSRDMREYGMTRFGESPEHGAELLTWLQRHYRPDLALGGDPLDVRQRGVVIFRKSAPAP